MKNRGLIIALIVLFSIVIIILIVLMIFLLNSKGRISKYMFGSSVSNNLIMDEVYNNTFNTIRVKASTSDVYFKSTNDSNIRVVIHGNEKELDVKQSSDELNINFKEKKCFGFCFNLKKNKVEVYIPSNYDKKIIIDSDYGNIDVEEFKSADMDISDDCGDIKILSANELKVENDYGNINIGEVNILTVEDDCGDISVDKVNDITAKNSYGNISIKSILNSLDIKDDCGDVKIDNININKDSYISNDFGNIKIGNTNEIFIDAKTDLGKVKINNNDRRSDITLKIKNDCGDIKVNN